RLSKQAVAEASALVVRTYELGALLDAAAACADGVVLRGPDGSLRHAAVTCSAVAAGVHGTLRDEAGVIAIDGDALATAAVTRVSGAPRLFESSGDVAGFGGHGALVSWRWWSPAEALRALSPTPHPALLLLDGRTSGVVYAGSAVPLPAVFVGLRTAAPPELLRQQVGGIATRLGTDVEARTVAGLDALCLDGTGLLPEFEPCFARHAGLGGVVVGFNEATLARALADIAPAGPPSLRVDMEAVSAADGALPGFTPWPMRSVAFVGAGPKMHVQVTR
ncbi:MAG TPA: hypothetical protein VGF99_11015, partial [Myxococcota bacterium]